MEIKYIELPMTVSGLIERLKEIEDNGGGNAEVYLDGYMMYEDHEIDWNTKICDINI